MCRSVSIKTICTLCILPSFLFQIKSSTSLPNDIITPLYRASQKNFKVELRAKYSIETWKMTTSRRNNRIGELRTTIVVVVVVVVDVVLILPPPPPHRSNLSLCFFFCVYKKKISID